MNKVAMFIKNNKLICIFFLLSINFIGFYLAYGDSSESYIKLVPWLNVIFQLSIGYVINFMFYVTQVYVPNYKRNSVVRKCISERLSNITCDMLSSIWCLEKIYLKNHVGTKYTREELDKLLDLKFDDHVKGIDVTKSIPPNFVYLTVRQELMDCIVQTEKDVDSLFKYYANSISVELMLLLEQIPKTTYHRVMKQLLLVPGGVDFSGSKKTNMFVPYYELICKLEELRGKEYMP